MSSELEALAGELMGLGKGPAAMVMGRVTAQKPLRILAEGNNQDAESLERSEGLDPDTLSVGDTVLLCPMEDRQRYVILTRVVRL